MKQHISIAVLATVMSLLLTPWSLSAQDNNTQNRETSTAILDTAIPFVIGAREGQQSLRGSFGWPTFQEGFVDGVYFRFDPDGYARFSPSPRLDEDVFEVVCQPATSICVAKKNNLEIGLTPEGKPQIQISGITPEDRFFLSDRKTELPLPNTILNPLDQKMEALLSAGGDLIIRRELETLQSLSLSGFSATVTYLRWVANTQASFVFPRGWPAPSQQPVTQNAVQNTSQNWTQSSISRLQPTLQDQNTQNINTQSLSLNGSILQGQRQPQPDQLEWNGTENDPSSAIGFAQQAQARNLTADVNKFTAPAPNNIALQDSSRVLTSQTEREVIVNPLFKAELANIRQSLQNLEVQVENLNKQITHLIRTNQSGQDIKASTTDTPSPSVSLSSPVKTDSTQPSEKEQLRNSVIQKLTDQSQAQKDEVQNAPETNPSGQVTVQKSIVERLIEELEETDTPNRTEAPPASNQSSNTSDAFISLSDYINKIVREEKQK